MMRFTSRRSPPRASHVPAFRIRSCLVIRASALVSAVEIFIIMNNTNEPNVSIDQNFKSTAYARLVESGERDRLSKELQRKLLECGWAEELKRFCTKVVKERGVSNITLDDLLTEVTPIARKNVPDSVRHETVAQIRAFLMKEMAGRT